MTTPSNELGALAKQFRCALEARLSGDTHDRYRLASKDGVNEFCRRYLEGLFPLYYAPQPHLEPQLAHFVEDLEARLAEQIVRAMHFDSSCRGKESPKNLAASAEEIVVSIRGRLPELARLLATDLQAALKNDPAASGLEEIWLSYPGVEAITVQRLAHELYQLKVPYLPRIMTELAHSRTGIDIHPGATIDDSFFIDHGTGVVIGETATIGKQVTIYHGVTLGAFNPTGRRDTGGALVRGMANKLQPRSYTRARTRDPHKRGYRLGMVFGEFDLGKAYLFGCKNGNILDAGETNLIQDGFCVSPSGTGVDAEINFPLGAIFHSFPQDPWQIGH
jgi:serine O-acetyltransferase